MTARTLAIDSSCMVAAVCSWHDRHEAVAAELERSLDAGARLAVPAHALAETYAVLTRLPAPHRLSPDDAWALVKANFVDRTGVAALDAEDYTAVLAALAESGIGGGRTYDALIAASARKGKAHALLTLNPKHFEPSRDLVIVQV